MAEQDQNRGAIAGEPPKVPDVISGGIVKSARNGGKSRTQKSSGGGSLKKNKSKNKGTSSQQTAPGDVTTSDKDKQKSLSSPATKQELINRIKSMPDEMIPQFIKPYAELMVNTFKIDTREQVANFFGQVAAESVRGSSEYVYYSKEKSLRKAFGSRVRPQDINDFIYKNPSNSRPFGFPPGKEPWSLTGWPDIYYGGRNGNTRGKVSLATNELKSVFPKKPISSWKIDPGYYKGSSEGYAYRGHGVIQITGKVQYEQMNEFFGRNGKYEKNDIDFLQNPEIATYDWRKNNNGVPNKFAFLSALMWWSNHKSTSMNKVSLGTTKTITGTVRGSNVGYQSRHKNVERYFYYLVNGVKPAAAPVQNSKSITSPPTYTKVVKPSQLKFLSIVPGVKPVEYRNRLGLKTFSNLSYFEGNGTPTPPYKDKTTQILKFLPGKQYHSFTIDKNNIARIYSADELPKVWSSMVYVCAGFPKLIQNGKPAYTDKGSKFGFNRLTGRTALGIKPSGEVVVYVSNSKYISNVIDDLLSMGCVEAINFDGGTSTFIYDNDTPLVTIGINSGRRFPSVLTWT